MSVTVTWASEGFIPRTPTVDFFQGRRKDLSREAISGENSLYSLGPKKSTFFAKKVPKNVKFQNQES